MQFKIPIFSPRKSKFLSKKGVFVAMRKIVFSVLVPLLMLAVASAVCFADVNDDMFTAAQRGDVEKVRLLLEKGADINYKDKIVLGHTPMTIAAAWGHTEIVKLLLDHGASVNQQNNDGTSALQCAASTTKSEMVKLLLDKGADVNHRDKVGRTPLFDATAQRCPSENTRLLLARGADVNAMDNKGRTAFYYAQANANQGVMEVLVKAGANGGKMPEAAPAGLTAADKQFLTGECKIEQSDIDVIPKLDAKTQQMLLSRIAMRNCTLLNSFNAVRNYYRSLKPKERLPMPSGDWVNADIYLTDEEFNRYVKIMQEAPF
jgi:ankyrin repeat protein